MGMGACCIVPGTPANMARNPAYIPYGPKLFRLSSKIRQACMKAADFSNSLISDYVSAAIGWISRIS
jgi:hypothetical protein